MFRPFSHRQLVIPIRLYPLERRPATPPRGRQIASLPIPPPNRARVLRRFLARSSPARPPYQSARRKTKRAERPPGTRLSAANSASVPSLSHEPKNESCTQV